MQHHRQSLADADADRRDAVAAATSAQLVRERAEDAHAGGAEWMPDGDRAAVDIDALGVELGPLAEAGERLGGEGLVELAPLAVLPADPRAAERLVRRLHGRDPEDVGVDRMGRARDDAR